MLSTLIYEKNCSTRPQNSVHPTPAWNEFTKIGVEFVPSTQTCFQGGIGFKPQVSERCAGAIIWPAERPKLIVERPQADLCWEKPCNVVLRKHKHCKKCKNDKCIFLTR